MCRNQDEKIRTPGRLSAVRLAALCAALFLGTACDDGSPTAPGPVPPPPATGLSIVFADPEPLSEYRPTIISLLEDTWTLVDSAIRVGAIQATVFADAQRAIPGWGMGGYAPNAAQIEIVIDPNFPGLADLLPQRLPQIAAHEMHHAVRWRGPGYGTTLLETMVSEGMADHFAVELLGVPLAPWSDALSGNEIEFYMNRARQEFDSTTFNFNNWFFGIGDLPVWTGYTLGFVLVDDFKIRNPGSSGASLVGASAEIFRPQ